MTVRYPRLSLRNFNHILTLIVVGLAVYLMFIPAAPAASWWVKHQAPLISKPPSVDIPQTPPSENTLLIPSIGLEQIIHEGATQSALHKGVWHRPKTSTPDTASNTVLAGHRFTYRDPAVFYNLDKVSLNDAITVFWNQKRYNYKVTNIQTVAPTAIEVEAPTPTAKLTIYTCTPLWSTSSRLVITAEPKETV